MVYGTRQSSLLQVFALLVSVSIVNGAYECPVLWKDKLSSSTCAGAQSESCTDTSCCIAPRFCSEFAVAWGITQLAGGGCAADNKFFDMKKASTAVADPAGAAEVKAACCTPFADATCSDWAPVKSCNSGDIVAEADQSKSAVDTPGSSPWMSNDKFKESCCSTPIETCSQFAVAWAVAQAIGGGCAADHKFFDTKKAGTAVADPAGDAEVKAACCTPFADATCGDWAPVKSCKLGDFVAQADKSDSAVDTPSHLRDDRFKNSCCSAAPTPSPPATTCATFEVAFAIAQLAGGGCAADNKFFDTKKATTAVADPAGDAEVKAACCTSFADATCGDWAPVKSCNLGDLVVDHAKSAVDTPDSSPWMSNDKFKELCCGKTCSEFRVAWAVAQAIGGGCAADNKFFDTKKASTAVADPAGDGEVKAACCTPFADATCSDWAPVKSCNSGDIVSEADQSKSAVDTPSNMRDVKFKESCCSLEPKPCSQFVVAWAVAQLAGGGCAADNKFFDSNKASAIVAEPAGDDEIKAACCTPFADATCGDWAPVKSCKLGDFVVDHAKSAIDTPDSSPWMSNDKYKELCCGPPMKCEDWTYEVDSAPYQGFPFACIVLAALAAGISATGPGL
jgi:predicted SnoaL-like aldol condensation-catalyzing enzyme